MSRTIASILVVLVIVGAPLLAVDMDVIKYIESRGDPNTIGEDGEVGLYQISPICLKSWNRFNKENYSRKDLFDPEINKRIATWYIEERIPQMLRYYSIDVTTRNKIWAYNAGIGQVKKGTMPRVTKQYIEKYRELVKDGVDYTSDG